MVRHFAVIGAAWVVATAAVTAVALNVPILPAVASREGRISDDAFMTLLVAAIPVFFLVHAVLLYSVWRFRATTVAGDGPPIGGHRTLETGWVVVTLVMVLALAAYGWNGMDEMRSAGAAAARRVGHDLAAAAGLPARGELRVKVIGSQFAWRFDYPDLGVKSVELRLPKDRPVRFEISSPDVLHSFWIPAFRTKQDAVPGRTITLLVTPTAVGRYTAECTVLCGAGHTVMRSPVEVMEPTAFDDWAAKQRAAAGP